MSADGYGKLNRLQSALFDVPIPASTSAHWWAPYGQAPTDAGVDALTTLRPPGPATAIRQSPSIGQAQHRRAGPKCSCYPQQQPHPGGLYKNGEAVVRGGLFLAERRSGRCPFMGNLGISGPTPQQDRPLPPSNADGRRDNEGAHAVARSADGSPCSGFRPNPAGQPAISIWVAPISRVDSKGTSIRPRSRPMGKRVPGFQPLGRRRTH